MNAALKQKPNEANEAKSVKHWFIGNTLQTSIWVKPATSPVSIDHLSCICSRLGRKVESHYLAPFAAAPTRFLQYAASRDLFRYGCT